MSVKIRQYCPEDHPLLCEMAVSLYREDGLGSMEPATVTRTADFLTENPSFGTILIAAGADGKVVGYCIAVIFWSNEYAGPVAILDELFVRPEFRGEGAGRAMIRHVEDWARSKKASAVFLEVEEHNANAQRLYESLSFRRSRRHHYIKAL